MQAAIVEAVGRRASISRRRQPGHPLLGDAIATNLFLLGYAWQKGWVPVSEASLDKAIELNGAASR
jgi:indolepyruvate ferredoxin oxidoreductase